MQGVGLTVHKASAVVPLRDDLSPVRPIRQRTRKHVAWFGTTCPSQEIILNCVTLDGTVYLPPFPLKQWVFGPYFVEISHEPLVKHDVALYVYR
jgi:hypothetical protein